jgi:hypothetical protein
VNETTKTTFTNATLIVWFTAGSICRKFFNVTEMDKAGEMLKITTHGEVVIVNFNNVNIIEVLEEVQ